MPAQFADIKVGYSCNNDCIHCVIADKRRSLQQRGRRLDRTTEEVKEQISEAKRGGVSSVVITGGEATIRRDFHDIINFAREQDLGIWLQSNGRAFSIREFAEMAANSKAITHYTIALNGPNEDIADTISRSKGSFAQTVLGMKNLVSLNQKVGGKIVLSKFNYMHVPGIIRVFHSAGVKSCNIAFPHGQGNAFRYFDRVVPRYVDVKPFVDETILTAKQLGIYVDFEAIPFCFLKGNESLVSELKIQEGQLRDMDFINLNYAETRRNVAKKKGPGCTECKYFRICEGPWVEYPERFGFDEFLPVKE